MKPLAGIANEAAAAPWHCAQLFVVLGALAWIALSVGLTVKPPTWQDVQVALGAADRAYVIESGQVTLSGPARATGATGAPAVPVPC